jgi:hypothetical protein
VLATFSPSRRSQCLIDALAGHLEMPLGRQKHLSANPTNQELAAAWYKVRSRCDGNNDSRWPVSLRLRVAYGRPVASIFTESSESTDEMVVEFDTHFLSGFSLVDTEAFSFSNFANCSRT